MTRLFLLLAASFLLYSSAYSQENASVRRKRTEKGATVSNPGEKAMEKAIKEVAAKDSELQKALADPNLDAVQRAQIEKERDKIQAFVDQGDASMPTSALVKNSASDYYRGRGDLKRSEQLAEQGLAHASPDGDPKLTANLLFNRGLSRYSEGKFEESYSDGKIAHELDPENKAALELYRYSESALRAKFLVPEIGEHVDRLRALADTSVPHNINEWLKKNYKNNPTEGVKHTIEALASFRKGDLPSALGHAHAAVKASPQDPLARFMRGRIQSELGDFNEVIIDMDHAHHKGWLDPKLYIIRADASLRQAKSGRVKELDRKSLYRSALADAEMAITMSTADARAYHIRSSAKLDLQYPAAEILEDIRAKAEDFKGDRYYEDFMADFEGKLAPSKGNDAEGAAPPPAPEIPSDWRDLAGKAFFGFSAIVFLAALYKRLKTA